MNEILAEFMGWDKVDNNSEIVYNTRDGEERSLEMVGGWNPRRLPYDYEELLARIMELNFHIILDGDADTWVCELYSDVNQPSYYYLLATGDGKNHREAVCNAVEILVGNIKTKGLEYLRQEFNKGW